MSPELLPQLSRRERQVMNLLYASSPATVGDLRRRLPDPPSYSAVRATLRVLEEKGHVVHEPDGRRYVYRPMVQPEKARTAALKDMVRTFFNGSVEQAAVALLRLSDTRLTPPQLADLAREVDEARKKGR